MMLAALCRTYRQQLSKIITQVQTIPVRKNRPHSICGNNNKQFANLFRPAQNIPEGLIRAIGSLFSAVSKSVKQFY
jgi:hypothetical protein